MKSNQIVFTYKKEPLPHTVRLTLTPHPYPNPMDKELEQWLAVEDLDNKAETWVEILSGDKAGLQVENDSKLKKSQQRMAGHQEQISR